jgi:hypothetical protein
MKKYKLIKEYPGSPEVDTEIIKSYISNSSLGNYDTYMIKGEGWFKLDDPENYPEFWELVVEKDYEILRFILPGNNIIHVQNAKNNIEFMLKNSNTYKIYQVKRLSDGEIFTIGDKIQYYDTYGVKSHNHKINTITIYKNNILLNHNHGSWKSHGDFNKVKKVKQPLFTTEDGVDIFEGDSFYNINNKDWLLRNIIKINLLDYQTYYKNQINFSTKEKAEEYILMNKPCLSLKEVLDIVPFLDRSERKLKELVKQKLNNNN